MLTGPYRGKRLYLNLLVNLVRNRDQLTVSHSSEREVGSEFRYSLREEEFLSGCIETNRRRDSRIDSGLWEKRKAVGDPCATAATHRFSPGGFSRSEQVKSTNQVDTVVHYGTQIPHHIYTEAPIKRKGFGREGLNVFLLLAP